MRKRAKKEEVVNAVVTRDLSIKLGCDPEFLMFYGNRSADAGIMFDSFFKGHEFGAEKSIRIPTVGMIGIEGPMAEMRPEPSSSPEGLTKNIHTLITTMYEQMPFLDLTPLSIGRPVGGHIHVDAPEEFESSGKINCRVGRIMSTMLMPIFASEHRVCAASRFTQSGYGHANDIRYDHKNSQLCAELRAPTSEWIATPIICKSTLAYVAVVWSEVMNNHLKLSKTDVVFKNQPQIEAVQRMILSDYKPIGESLISEIKKLVQTFKLYPAFKEECDLILNPKAAFEEKEKYGWNMYRGWGLSEQTKTVTKRSLMGEKGIREKARRMNADLINNTLAIPYNDDYNVEIYSKAITERIATLGWDIKNEYFLYGLKKGIKGFSAAKINNGEYFSIPDNALQKDVVAAVEKMKNRFLNIRGLANGTRVDPKTGKCRSGNVDAIVIGIPYDIRVEKDIKPLINLIWRIERKDIKGKQVTEMIWPTEEQLTSNSKKELGNSEVVAIPEAMQKELDKQEDVTPQVNGATLSDVWHGVETRSPVTLITENIQLKVNPFEDFE